MIDDVHALMWSAKQNAAHVERFSVTLSNGRNAYRENSQTDWVLLMVGPIGDMLALAENMRPTLVAREAA